MLENIKKTLNKYTQQFRDLEYIYPYPILDNEVKNKMALLKEIIIDLESLIRFTREY